MVKPYRWLAEYYDEIFSPFRAPVDAAREKLLKRIMPDVRTACDLACGTGTTALSLARRGVRMYAVDLSPLMCRLTREKAAAAGAPVDVLQADMRSFRLPEAVDLITCESDALNHIPRKSDLRRVAGAVSRALQPGGYFFFDVNNALGFEQYWTGVVWVEKPGVALLMRNGHNRKRDRAWSDVEWFVQEGKLWRRQQERVEEVCWEDAEIRRELRAAGFDQIRSWDPAPFFKGSSMVGPGCRTLYLARKGSGGPLKPARKA